MPAAETAPRRAAGRVVDLIRRRPELVTTLLCALVLAAGIRGPDLPAQNYRVWLLRTHGLIIFDSHWYAGHTLPGYSLLFPPIAAVVGPRLLGALACIASTAAFTRLLRGKRDTGDDVAILWFAVIPVVDLVVGRLPLYGLVSILLYVVPNPIGGNVIRLGAIFAGPLAAYVCMRHRMPVILALVAGPLLAWQLWQLPDAIANGGDRKSAHAGYYAGLVDYLHAHQLPVGRVEVPLTRGRWETDYLAAKVPLARGWERQVDLG